MVVSSCAAGDPQLKITGIKSVGLFLKPYVIILNLCIPKIPKLILI